MMRNLTHYFQSSVNTKTKQPTDGKQEDDQNITSEKQILDSKQEKCNSKDISHPTDTSKRRGRPKKSIDDKLKLFEAPSKNKCKNKESIDSKKETSIVDNHVDSPTESNKKQGSTVIVNGEPVNGTVCQVIASPNTSASLSGVGSTDHCNDEVVELAPEPEVANKSAASVLITTETVSEVSNEVKETPMAETSKENSVMETKKSQENRENLKKSKLSLKKSDKDSKMQTMDSGSNVCHDKSTADSSSKNVADQGIKSTPIAKKPSNLSLTHHRREGTSKEKSIETKEKSQNYETGPADDIDNKSEVNTPNQSSAVGPECIDLVLDEKCDVVQSQTTNKKESPNAFKLLMATSKAAWSDDVKTGKKGGSPVDKEQKKRKRSKEEEETKSGKSRSKAAHTKDRAEKIGAGPADKEEKKRKREKQEEETRSEKSTSKSTRTEEVKVEKFSESPADKEEKKRKREKEQEETRSEKCTSKTARTEEAKVEKCSESPAGEEEKKRKRHKEDEETKPEKPASKSTRTEEVKIEKDSASPADIEPKKSKREKQEEETRPEKLTSKVTRTEEVKMDKCGRSPANNEEKKRKREKQDDETGPEKSTSKLTRTDDVKKDKNNASPANEKRKRQTQENDNVEAKLEKSAGKAPQTKEANPEENDGNLADDQKKHKKQEAELVEETSPEKLNVCKGKRKRAIISDDEEDVIQQSSKRNEVPKVSKPSGLYNYFSPVCKEEAKKKAVESLSNRVVCAEVHPVPESGRKLSLGPVRRTQRTSRGEDEEIIVLSTEESLPAPVTKKPFKFKTPEKRKKKRPQWKLKIKLLSPAKPLEDSTDDSSCSDSDSEDFEVGSPSPSNKKKNVSLAPIFLPRQRKTETASTSNIPSKVVRRIVPSVAMAPIRAAPTEHTIGFADVDPTTPMAVLFPPISHVTQHVKVEKQEGESLSDLSDNAAVPEISLDIPLGTFINTSEPTSAKPDLTVSSRNCQNEGEAWCESFRPKLSTEVAGNSNSVQRLKDWLEGWRQRIVTSEEQPANTSDSDGSDYSSEDDFICSDDDFGSSKKGKRKRKKGHCNTALLVGPCGSGKTAAVYAVAEELGFKVLEMNASSRRTGKRILSELQEATQSHQVRNTVDQETLNSFFSNKSKKKEEVNESQQSGSNPGLSLILVEDVDVVFEEQDEGFLAALNVLAATSKRPLVLVSNDPQCSLLLSRQHRLHLEFNKVPATTAGPVIQKMCQTLGVKVEEGQLAGLLRQCNGDLRRAVLLAQTWTLSGGLPQSYDDSVSVDLSKLWFNLSSVSLPFIVTDAEIEDAGDTDAANTTWNSGIEEDSDDEIFPKKKVAKRQRLTSDNLNDCTAPNSSTLPSDLKKTQRLTDILATLNVLQGTGSRPMISYERPGLSDQECHDGPTDCFRQQLQQWLITKSLSVCGASLAQRNLEEIESWRTAHIAVDQELLDQLPLNCQLEHKTVAEDLLPALRGFGRIEQYSSRSSRRSKLNALTTLGFSLSALHMENLQFIFPTPAEDTS